ncbi:DUF2909 domain-containing protein [Pseudoalteromonas xiamenensis]
MIIKIIIVLLLGFVLFNLFRALFLMVSGKAGDKPMSYFLGRRVLFSAIVLAFILVAAKLGLIHFNPNPHHVKERTQTQTNIAIPHQQNASTKLLLGTRNVVCC